MSKANLKRILEHRLQEDGLYDTGIPGVQIFRYTAPRQCSPAVYVPTIIAIVSGSKEAILDGQSYIYDCEQYMCCTMTMPVEAGIAYATSDTPLLGVSISIDTKLMSEITFEINQITEAIETSDSEKHTHGITLSSWDESFENALFRLIQLETDSVAASVLGSSRLREVYYAVLTGAAGNSVRHTFGSDNDINRAIRYLSSNLSAPTSIDDIRIRVGMSRSVFHRKFKQATMMSPIQFLKAMRLNHAAMLITKGQNVNEAATEVGYRSSSQFSREFKRMFGSSPKQWSLKQ